MDIVYICRPGDNVELLYSLRSLRNLADTEQVWIFGDCPNWVNRDTVNVVNVERAGTKFDIGLRNMQAACDQPHVSEHFILMNDDFYITEPVDTIPALHRGPVRGVIDEYKAMGIESSYTRSMADTLATLEDVGYKDVLSYELHTPMLMTKAGLNQAIRIRTIDRWNVRTAYGAMTNLGGTKHRDVKVYRRTDPIPRGPFLSTSDQSIRWVKDHLNRLFPTPSPYET